MENKNKKIRADQYIAYLVAGVFGGILIYSVNYTFWRYVFSVILFCGVYLLMYCFCLRKVIISTRMECCLQIGIIIFWAIVLRIYYYTDIYISQGLLFGNWFFSMFPVGIIQGIFVCVCGCIICVIMHRRKNLRINRIFLWGTVLFIAFVSSFWFIKYAQPYDVHFDAYFYPVYRVASGQTSFVNFNNIYGGYVYFLAPFITTTGITAVMQFSTTICVCAFITFLSLFLFLYQNCRNKLVAVLGICATMFYPVIFLTKQQGNAFYMQYAPHRMLFPALVFCLCGFYIHYYDTHVRLIRNIVIVVNAAAMVWNVETGIICIALFFMMELYMNLFKHPKAMIKRVVGSIVAVAISVALAILFLESVTWARTGVMLNLDNIFYGEQMLASGLLLQTYPFSQTQLTCWLVIGVFAGLELMRVLSVFRKYRNIEDVKIKYGAVHWLLALMLLGNMTYPVFKGVHPYNLTCVLYTTMLILTVWADEALDVYFNEKEKGVKRVWGIKSIVFLSIISLYGGSFLLDFRETNKICYEGVEIYLPETLGNIEEHCGKSGVDIITINSSYLYCMMDRPDDEKIPALVDIFTGKETEEVLGYIEDSDNMLVVDLLFMDKMEKMDNGKWMPRFNEIVAENFYEPWVSPNERLWIYTRK